MNQIKILLLMPGENSGGVGKFYNELYSGLKQNNVIEKKYFKYPPFNLGSYDIIQASAIPKYCIIPFIIFRKKIVFTLHGNYLKENRNLFKKLMWNLYLNHVFIHVVCPSNWLKKQINKNNAITIYNGGDLKLKIKKPIEVNNKKIVLLETQNFNIWEKCRKIVVLINIIKKINRDYPIKLLIAGSGNYLDYFKSKYKNTKFIKFIGFKNNLYSYIKRADIITNYSGLDTFSYFILECLILGKPIVANAVGGIPELVGNSVLLSKNPLEYKLNLIKLIKNDKLCKALSIKAHIRSKKFTSKQMSKNYLKLYKSICRSS